MKTAVLFLTLVSCASPVGRVPAGVWTVDAYEVHPTLTTPGGVAADPSGQDLPPAYLEVLDRVVAEVELCVGAEWTDPVVKVASDWRPNCDATEQVLPVVAGVGDPNKADNFGLPCTYAYWRAILQSDASIVTTPSLRNFKDPLVRLLTGRQDVWSHADTAACAQPTTGALYGP